MEQVTGLAWLTGHVDDQPRIQRGPCDPNGGMHAVFGALVALEVRDRTGVGSLVESHDVRGRARTSPPSSSSSGPRTATRIAREGNRSPWAAPQGLYAHRHARALAGRLGGDRRPVDGDGRCPRAPGLGDRSRAGHARRSACRARPARRRRSAPGPRTIDLDKAIDLLVGAGVPAAPVCDGRRSSAAPAVRRPRLLRGPRPPDHRRRSSTRRCRSATPASTAGSARRRRCSASTTTRSSPTSASPHEEIAALEADDLIGTTPLGL